MKKPLLGLCPIGKFVFSHIDALRYKQIIERKLKEWDIDYVGIDDVLPDGIVRSQDHVEPVVKHLKAKNVDALFIPHCNFGTEGAAGVIARDMGVPVLLWGPRDEAPLADGTRLRDTLCGLFASSKVLHKLGVKFTYIENCSPDEDLFKEGVQRFTAAVNVIAKAKRMRIGVIGQRIDFFWTTIVNESELLERFGVEMLPVDMVEFTSDVRDLARRERQKYLEEIERERQWLKFGALDGKDELIHLYAARDRMLSLAQERGLDAFALQSFNSICTELGCAIDYTMAMVNDAGVPVACETDIHGAVSTVLLQAATGRKDPVMLADLTVRHPDNDNAVLLWHAGFAADLRDTSGRAELGEHWILPGFLPGSTHWKMKDGPLTVFRFDGDRGSYSCLAGEGKTVEGPTTENNYMWMEVNDWPAWERAFIEGPYIHHVACAYGHQADVLQEAFRYIGGVSLSVLP
ncbi:MAG: fucose isomerase [bacterium]|nr:fucose isomerase [bacterium]